MANGHLGRRVSAAGAGYTPLGNVLSDPELKGLSERELVSYACMEAMKNSGISATDIDAFFVGMSGPNFEAKLKSGGPFFADWIGTHNKPTLFHDEGCGTSAVGLNMAVMAVASGVYDCVISTAVNINHSSPYPAIPPHIRRVQTNDEMWDSIWTGSDAAYSRPAQGGLAISDASAITYCKRYGLSFDTLDESIISYMMTKRKEALLNPKNLNVKETYEEEAKRFGFDSVKDYLLNDKFDPRMGYFVRARTLGQTVDGASAVIVCSTEMAKKLNRPCPEVIGIGSACFPEKNFGQMPVDGEISMFKAAYGMAGITNPRKEVNYLSSHDCPIISVFSTAEASGYMDPGETYKMMLSGDCGFDGKRPITTSGGRTQLGHPRSPAFNIEVAEAINQMRGENGPRQMPEPPKISIVSGGGSGVAAACCVLKLD